MSSGFQFQGTDLEQLCEIRRNATSAGFGGAAGRFVGANGDLFDRFANQPTAFDYSTPAWSASLNPQPYTWSGFNTSKIPSKQGYRPNSTAEQIILNSAGVWSVWRDVANRRICLKNPSGTITYTPASYWGGNLPNIVVIKMVGGGGKGGNGSGTMGGAGGGGGGGWVGWMVIPDTEASPLICSVGAARNHSRVTHSPSGQYVECLRGADGGNATSSGAAGGAVARAITTMGGTFITRNGGASSGGGTADGAGVSVPAFSISPETSFSAWSKAGGGGGGRGGGGGASMLGVGGSKGQNSVPAGAGGLYGGGGGGGTWVLFNGRPGAAGARGVIILGY